MQQIKNIIFDLGGIFLNIDFARTASAFQALGFNDFNTLYTQHHATAIFESLETGSISPAEFCDHFRIETGTNFTDQDIFNAWNALLCDFPQERINWLAGIKERYHVYLFSNTNQIHYEAFSAIFRNQSRESDFNSYFIKAYYSHKMGLRKPHVASFEYIIQEQQLNPAETLFIDDTLKNIEAAKETGLQTIHLLPPKTMLDLDL